MYNFLQYAIVNFERKQGNYGSIFIFKMQHQNAVWEGCYYSNFYFFYPNEERTQQKFKKVWGFYFENVTSDCSDTEGQPFLLIGNIEGSAHRKHLRSFENATTESPDSYWVKVWGCIWSFWKTRCNYLQSTTL